MLKQISIDKENNMPDWLDAYLGKAKNMKLTPAVKAAKMARKATPMGMLSSAFVYALNHGLNKSEEYKQEFDNKWIKTLGYEGMPRLEMYIGESAEADFDRDWRQYWDEHPDNHSNP